MTMRRYRLDLHVHTCLSPCADLRMTPPVIVERARDAGIDIVGICDHNAADNVPAVMEAGRAAGIVVFGGMEITTCEEIHVLALFDDLGALAKMQTTVSEKLGGKNDPDIFGEQVVVDRDGRPTAINEELLIGAADISITRTVAAVHGLGGVVIASHVDREAYSLVSHLGFVPPFLKLDALELSANHDPEEPERHRYTGIPLVTFSDAHTPEGIGAATTVLELGEPTVAALAVCLRTMRRGSETK